MGNENILLATLGTGNGSETPIIITIKKLKPQKIILFVSDGSKESQVYKNVRSCCDKKADVEIVNVKDCNNAEEIYESALKKIADIKNEGHSGEDIHINYTGGTKAMAVGIVIAGIAECCGNFHYIGGDRRESVAGRVMKGHEKMFVSGFAVVSLDQELRKAADYFNAGEFEASGECLKKLNEEFGLTENGDEKACFIDNCIRTYRLWHQGEYKSAKEAMKKVVVPENADKETKDRINMNKEVLNQLEEKKQLQAFDRAASSERAIKKGYYNFAAEDIYSSLEYIAAFILGKKGIDKSNVDPEKIKEDVSDFITKKGGIGLFDAFRLAAKLGDELGKKFIDDKKIFNALKTRNEFIHQGKPVKKEDVENFYNCAKIYYELFLKEYGELKEKNLEKLMEKFRFPRI